MLTTTFLTARASFKAADEIFYAERGSIGNAKHRSLTFKEKAALTWTLYIPPAVTGLVTVGCIIGSTRISVRRGAVLAAAYSVLERGAEEYQEKVIERLGETKEQSIRDEIAQDKVDRTSFNSKEVVVISGKDVLCLDTYSGRIFTSNMETLLQARNLVNHKTHSNLYATVSDFYEWIGLDPTDMSDDFGWTSDKMLELDITTALKDDKPVLVVSFRTRPVKV